MRNLFSFLLLFGAVSLFSATISEPVISSIDKLLISVKGWTFNGLTVSSAKAHDFVCEKTYTKKKSIMVVSILRGGAVTNALSKGIEQAPSMRVKGFPLTIQSSEKGRGRVVVSLGMTNQYPTLLAVDFYHSTSQKALSFLQHFDWAAIKMAITTKD